MEVIYQSSFPKVGSVQGDTLSWFVWDWSFPGHRDFAAKASKVLGKSWANPGMSWAL